MGRHRKTVTERMAEGRYIPTRHGPAPGCEFATFPAAPSEPPAFFDAWARGVWTRLYPVLSESQVLSAGEYDVFTAFCLSAGRYYRAESEIAKSSGDFSKRAKRKKKPPASFDIEPADGMTAREWLAVSSVAFRDMMVAARSLGLTAVDRTRIIKPIGPNSEKLPPSRPKTALDKLGIAGRAG